MEAEFPADYAIVVKIMPRTAKGLKKKMVGQEQSRKRKFGEDGEELDPKSRLNSAMALVSPQPITKGMIEYEIVEQDGTTTASVTLKCLEGKPQSFTGEPQDGVSQKIKKDAEKSAAAAALEGLKVQIEAATGAHAETKKARTAEKSEAWKVVLAKKKEEEAAEKAAKKAKTEA